MEIETDRFESAMMSGGNLSPGNVCPDCSSTDTELISTTGAEDIYGCHRCGLKYTKENAGKANETENNNQPSRSTGRGPAENQNVLGR